MSLVELARFYGGAEGEIACAKLEANGIPALLFDSSTVYVGMTTGVRLMVHEDDRAEALRILSERA